MLDLTKKEARDPNETKIDFGHWVRKIAVELGIDESCDYGLNTLIHRTRKLNSRPDLTKEEAAALLCEVDENYNCPICPCEPLKSGNRCHYDGEGMKEIAAKLCTFIFSETDTDTEEETLP